MLKTCSKNSKDLFLLDEIKKWVAPWALIYESSKIPSNKLPDFSEIFEVKNNILYIDGKSTGVNVAGIEGKSAYDIALDNGFIGSELSWLRSLKGDSGISSYVHIAYANYNNGVWEDFSTTNSTDRKYIGIYTDNIISGSNDPNDYKWSLFKGKDGVNGIDGHDGQDGLNGRDGVDGASGTSDYFHIAYANKDEFGNIILFSLDDPTDREYIGTYVDQTRSDSLDSNKYHWMLVKGAQGRDGEDGIPGADGTDGKTSYLHIKYSDDGRTFTLNNGETPGNYLGQYVDFNQKDSTTFSDYKWVLIKGTPGTDGKDGLGINIKGSFDSTDDLPTSYNKAGDAYTVGLNIYVWNGEEWKNCGQFRGEKGDTGNDGANAYVHFAYCNDLTNYTDFTTSIEDGDDYKYIGVYTDNTQADSDDPTKYYWSPFRGKDGKNGEYVEFIYKRFDSPQTFINDNSNPAYWLANQVKDYFGPSGYEWSDNPQGVNNTLQYEYVATRTYDGNSFSKFTTPVIWSKWGEKGQDGDGYEYIYKRFTTIQTWNPDDNNPANWQVSQNDEFYGPTGYEWSDDPQGVNSTLMYEYVSTRKKINGLWGAYSTPSLWSRYAPAGSNGGHWEFAYKNSTTDPTPLTEGLTINDAISAGWTRNPSSPNFNIGEYTWMTQVFVSGEGQYGIWTTPIKITGEKGLKGEDGDNAPYADIMYGKSSYSTAGASGPSDISSWQTTPPQRTFGTFIWMRVQNYDSAGTLQSVSYICLTGDKGDKGTSGSVSKWYEYAGVWGPDINSVTNSANIGYYVKYNDGFYMNLEDDGVANTTTPSASSSKWEQMAGDRNYYIAKAYFGDLAEFGSGIINGDWMISRVATSISPSSNYQDFDSSYPNTIHNNNFIPQFALDMRSGKVYLNDAELKGKVIANSGTIGGFNINASTLTSDFYITNGTGNVTLDSSGQLNLSKSSTNGNSHIQSSVVISTGDYNNDTGIYIEQVNQGQATTATRNIILCDKGLQLTPSSYKNWASDPLGVVPIQLAVDGSGWLAYGSIQWNSAGVITPSQAFALSVISALKVGGVVTFQENLSVTSLDTPVVQVSDSNSSASTTIDPGNITINDNDSGKSALILPDLVILSNNSDTVRLTTSGFSIYNSGKNAVWNTVADAVNAVSISNNNISTEKSITTPAITLEELGNPVTLTENGITYNGTTKTWAQIFAAIP